MKLELKENMYVRTNLGKIGKLKAIKPSYIKIEIKKNFCFTFEVEDIVKASYNIIDILEVGDYVNGLQVYEVDRECCRITLNGGEYGEEFRLTYLRPVLGKNMGIKTIVTKEQFEKMSYGLEN